MSILRLFKNYKQIFNPVFRLEHTREKKNDKE